MLFLLYLYVLLCRILCSWSSAPISLHVGRHCPRANYVQLSSLSSLQVVCHDPRSQLTMASSHTIRVAILECDTPIDSVREIYGSYGSIFSTLLQNARKESNLVTSELSISSYDVIAGVYPERDSYDALLVTGSSMCSLPPLEI